MAIYIEIEHTGTHKLSINNLSLWATKHVQEYSQQNHL